MDIRDCQLFIQLASTQHFGKVANAAHLSPSAVSRQLQRLETEVGKKLIERDNRHVRLTPAGRHFLDYAYQTVQAWQQLKRDLSDDPQTISGELSVYGSVTASFSLLSQILPVLRTRYPGVELKLRTGDQADGIERVLNNSEDCAIAAQPDILPSQLQFLALQQSPLYLIGPTMNCSLSQRLEEASAVNIPLDWTQIPVILAEHGLARERFLQRLRQLNLHPMIYAQVAGHEAVVAMVSLGFGVAVVPELVIKHSPRQDTIRILPWLDDLEPFRIGLCARQERLADPLLQAFWQSAQLAVFE
ncbi:HTH-type transcriptional activator IlvY [Thiothrix eikelboomii]|uniref:HTH-type transcriptional activator IlvY n=1 Tax=Thiothrix eikelboomii TaxID=92487 RepID=UPI003BAFE672